MKTTNDRQILICVESLRYDSDSKVIRYISELEYSQLPVSAGSRVDTKPNAKYIYTRVSRRAAQLIEFGNVSNYHNRLIAEKYNVGHNWKQNRWFVEQVRPTLF